MKQEHKKHLQRGQGLVEFSLIAMTLIMTIVVGIEVLNLVAQWYTLHQVADWGVREAAKDGGGTTRVLTELNNQMQRRGVNSTTVTVEVFAVEVSGDGSITPIQPITPYCDYGGDIAVELSQPWQTIILGSLLGEHDFVALHTFECWRGRIP